MKNEEQFIEAARNGIVTVKFKKADTEEIRIMPCTLSHELSEGKVPETFPEPKNSNVFAVWCTDKQAWRSFRKDNVIEWYEGE